MYYALQRTWKPFNPILGETYELVNHAGITFIAEQVSRVVNASPGSHFNLSMVSLSDVSNYYYYFCADDSESCTIRLVITPQWVQHMQKMNISFMI